MENGILWTYFKFLGLGWKQQRTSGRQSPVFAMGVVPERTQRRRFFEHKVVKSTSSLQFKKVCCLEEDPLLRSAYNKEAYLLRLLETSKR